MYQFKLFLCVFFRDVKGNPEALEEIRNLWKEILKCGISIAAFIEDPNNRAGKPLVLGADILYVSTKKSRSHSKLVHVSFSKLLIISNKNIT